MTLCPSPGPLAAQNVRRRGTTALRECAGLLPASCARRMLPSPHVITTGRLLRAGLSPTEAPKLSRQLWGSHGGPLVACLCSPAAAAP